MKLPACIGTLFISVAIGCGSGGRPDAARDDSSDRSTSDSLVGCGTEPGDLDGDGYPLGEDCNDCSPQTNPGAYDEPGNDIDEDCDGEDAQRASLNCDADLPLASTSAIDAAKAMGLCKFIDPDDTGWGVLSARFAEASGTGRPDSRQIGILPDFGTLPPQAGQRLLALSSGVARSPSQAGFTSECDVFEDAIEDYAPGFPINSPSCPGVLAGLTYNSAALEVTLRVPTNALGLRFNTNFFTYEYPEYICDEFNDFFAVLQKTDDGEFENIVFDENGDAVSVNNALLSVCTPGTHGGKTFECPLGRAQLAGTGFDNSTECGAEGSEGEAANSGGATGWLRTTAPVVPGSTIVLRFAIWDSGDGILDSLALIDAFGWELEEVQAPNTEPELI